jgi:hypothetical protein
VNFAFRPADDILTLKWGSPATLALLRARRREIAAVLVNPLQALAANKPPPSDQSLATNVRGGADPDMAAYGAWLGTLCDVCRECDVVSILDEVYVGFRLAKGGAQEYFNAQADMVCRRSHPDHPLGPAVARPRCCKAPLCARTERFVCQLSLLWPRLGRSATARPSAAGCPSASSPARSAS